MAARRALQCLRACALVAVACTTIHAQSAVPLTPATTTWTGPRTSDGQPDVHGVYAKDWIGARGPNFDLEVGQDPAEMRATGRKPEDFPKPRPLLPRSVAEHVMAQLEDPANLDRWPDPSHRLITLILIRCGLRIFDALNLPLDPVVHDADDAPYLRYFNHKMKREALVPIDEQLHQHLREQQQRLLEQWPAGVTVLVPRRGANLRGDTPISASGYRCSLAEWLTRCDTRDELGRPVHLTPHRFRHTLGTRLINKDVPQDVVRQILDTPQAR